jgi:hypothetical protein
MATCLEHAHPEFKAACLLKHGADVESELLRHWLHSLECDDPLSEDLAHVVV